MREAIAEVFEVTTSKSGDRRLLTRGTAFAISSSVALTAFHVVGDRLTGKFRENPIILRFLVNTEIAVTCRDGDARLDVAVLELGDALPADLQPVALTCEANDLDEFQSAGHPLQRGPDLPYIHGKIVKFQSSIFGGVPAILLYADEAGNKMQLGGMSGGPVLVGSDREQAAIGLIRWNPESPDDNRISDGGHVYASPVRDIVERWPEFRPYTISRSLLAKFVKYPLPTVSEADCYDLLGVARSEYSDRYADRGGKTPYVPRNVDAELRNAIRQKAFVLLVGPSKAGKTRTAYEALLHVEPSNRVIVPFRAEDLPRIVDGLILSRERGSVLWLNDLDRYLNKGSLDVRVMNLVLGELRMKIVATIRSKAYTVLIGNSDDDLSRDAQQILRRATLLELNDQLSEEERQRATEAYPDLNLGPSLGESFIAGRVLKERYKFGDPSLRAIIRAASDWRRAGFTSPIVRHDLFELFKSHLKTLAPQLRQTEQAFNAGLDEACKPVALYSALLSIGRETESGREEEYYVVDYVNDFVEEENHPILNEGWSLALNRVQTGFDCMSVGFAARARGRVDIAEKAWTFGIQKSSAVCCLSLGYLLSEQRRTDQAEAAYREAIRIDPAYVLAYYDLAILMKATNRLKKAEEAYNQALRINSDFVPARYNLANLLRDMGRLQEAEGAYRAALRVDPNNSSVLGNLGKLLKDQSRSQEAEALYRSALRVNPKDTVTLNNLGDLMSEKENRLPEAEAAFREAIRIDSKDAKSYTNLGKCLKLQGRLQEAETMYREAIQIDPAYAMAHNNLGNLLKLQHRASEAEASYRESIRVDPNYALAYLNLGLFLRAQNRFQEAETVYRQALRIDPEYGDVHYNFGNLLRIQGRSTEAEAAYRNAMRVNPKNINALNNLGLIMKEQGRWRDAEAAFREALQIDPQFMPAHLNLVGLPSGRNRPR